MANNCIKTGAYLKVEPYGFYVPADLYEVGYCVVARINSKESYYYGTNATATHVVYLDHSPEFYHEVAGIIVVYHTQIEEV